jgi:hypothetical protein
MARTARNSTLESRAARARLRVRRKGKIRPVVLTDEAKQSFAEWTEEKAPADHVSCAPTVAFGAPRTRSGPWTMQQAGGSLASGEFPHPAPYPRISPGHERGTDGCDRSAARSCRYPYDRKALCPSSAELRRADYPGEFPDTWAR